MGSMRAALSTFLSGSRVRKPDAKFVDFAYLRTGTVVREMVDGKLHLGVVWDGDHHAFEYPGDYVFEAEPLNAAGLRGNTA
jgi:hypothetical protein